jgi:hypothetical protein
VVADCRPPFDTAHDDDQIGGLDNRFGWPAMPSLVAFGGDTLVVFPFCLYILVFSLQHPGGRKPESRINRFQRAGQAPDVPDGSAVLCRNSSGLFTLYIGVFGMRIFFESPVCVEFLNDTLRISLFNIQQK